MKFLKVPLRERIIRKAVEKRLKPTLSKKIDIQSFNEVIVIIDYIATYEHTLESIKNSFREKFGNTLHFILFAEQPVDILQGYHIMNPGDLKSSLEILHPDIILLLQRKYSLAIIFNPDHKQEIQYLATQVQSDLIVGSEKDRTDLYDIIIYDGVAMNLRSFVDHSIDLLLNISSS